MWSSRAAALVSASLLLLPAGCGPAKKDAKAGERPPQLSRRLEPSDLLPADLDIVVRVDVARLKAALGPVVAQSMASRAAGEGGEGFVAEAMAQADAVWIGLRLADIDAGDRVVVAEGRLGEIHIEPSEWKETTPTATMEGVQVLDRQVRAPRAGTGRIVVYEKKLYAFISPVEVDATTRLLKSGPDAGRGDPREDGVINIDVRGHRLPVGLEKKYPSIGAVIAGIARVQGSATMEGDHLRVAVDLTAKTEADAKRAEAFLTTVRDTAAQTRYADLMSGVKVERVQVHILMSAEVPAAMVAAALSE